MAASLERRDTLPAMNNRAKDLTLEMVKSLSVTQSRGELEFPKVLREIMLREDYFQRHPDAVWLANIPNDPFSRSNFVAFVRGSGSSSVVLTGHYDVVSTANYGPFEAWAGDPEALMPKLIADLRSNARSDAEKRALTDLESGEFLAGRGVLDMKSGLAAGLVAMFRFAKLEHRVGNLIFLAVADEEVQSHGARAATEQLRVLALENDWNIEAVINLDATSDQGDGTDGRAVYYGSVGKLLVSAYVAGIDTHAGYPFEGVNANYLLSSLSSRLECNPNLADRAHGEAAPPPTSLKQGDLKTHYDVTTPARAWACFNVLTHGKSPEIVMRDFRLEVQAALEEAMDNLRTRATAWGLERAEALIVEPFVLGFGELCATARERHGEAFDQHLQTFIAQLEPQLDIPTASQRITDFVWSVSELIGPAVVLGFGSLHYPAVLLESGKITKLVQEVLNDTLARGIGVRERLFFAGISDMSWYGSAQNTNLEFVNRNTPAPQAHMLNPLLNVPTINIGPWGRDYHQWLERAHVEYTFEQLPELVWQIAQKILNDAN
jgi:arginine utilization protein RocB